MTATPFNRSPLRGVRILLSASVPSSDRSAEFHGIPLDRAQTEVEQAVISVARAIYAAGGRIVCGGHPTITPILAIVAGEYVNTVAAERPEARDDPSVASDEGAPLIVHQLEAYRERIAAATIILEQLGQAQIIWHGVDPSEAGVPWPSNVPPYPVSLQRMRESMIDDPAMRAMVCIGGMEGVRDEAMMFLKTAPMGRVYVLESTGGAAAMMAAQFRRATTLEGRVRVIDDEVLGARREDLRDADRGSALRTPQFIPYPLIAQAIVRGLAG